MKKFKIKINRRVFVFYASDFNDALSMASRWMVNHWHRPMKSTDLVEVNGINVE